jgi:hypothetical protein
VLTGARGPAAVDRREWAHASGLARKSCGWGERERGQAGEAGYAGWNTGCGTRGARPGCRRRRQPGFARAAACTGARQTVPRLSRPQQINDRATLASCVWPRGTGRAACAACTACAAHLISGDTSSNTSSCGSERRRSGGGGEGAAACLTCVCVCVVWGGGRRRGDHPPPEASSRRRAAASSQPSLRRCWIAMPTLALGRPPCPSTLLLNSNKQLAPPAPLPPGSLLRQTPSRTQTPAAAAPRRGRRWSPGRGTSQHRRQGRHPRQLQRTNRRPRCKWSGDGSCWGCAPKRMLCCAQAMAARQLSAQARNDIGGGRCRLAPCDPPHVLPHSPAQRRQPGAGPSSAAAAAPPRPPQRGAHAAAHPDVAAQHLQLLVHPAPLQPLLQGGFGERVGRRRDGGRSARHPPT